MMGESLLAIVNICLIGHLLNVLSAFVTVKDDFQIYEHQNQL